MRCRADRGDCRRGARAGAGRWRGVCAGRGCCGVVRGEKRATGDNGVAAWGRDGRVSGTPTSGAQAAGTPTSATFAYDLEPGERIGFVTPTHFWDLPRPVAEYVRDLRLTRDGAPIDPRSDACAYCVSTFGTTPGRSGADLGDALQRRERGCFGPRLQPPAIACKVAGGFCGPMSETSRFSVTDACIDCGLCARKCPPAAIEMRGEGRDARPVWVADHCALCRGCLHRCPKNAIEYGKSERSRPRTRRHGQFRNPHARV